MKLSTSLPNMSSSALTLWDLYISFCSCCYFVIIYEYILYFFFVIFVHVAINKAKFNEIEKNIFSSYTITNNYKKEKKKKKLRGFFPLLIEKNRSTSLFWAWLFVFISFLLLFSFATKKRKIEIFFFSPHSIYCILI